MACSGGRIGVAGQDKAGHLFQKPLLFTDEKRRRLGLRQNISDSEYILAARGGSPIKLMHSGKCQLEHLRTPESGRCSSLKNLFHRRILASVAPALCQRCKLNQTMGQLFDKYCRWVRVGAYYCLSAALSFLFGLCSCMQL